MFGISFYKSLHRVLEYIAVLRRAFGDHNIEVFVFDPFFSCRNSNPGEQTLLVVIWQPALEIRLGERVLPIDIALAVFLTDSESLASCRIERAISLVLSVRCRQLLPLTLFETFLLPLPSSSLPWTLFRPLMCSLLWP